ncbi:MAG: glutamyl-tRNA reductase [Chloroflexi bacterium]|nr:glutamyl-tRNA reductase [Chloroflexota bacterium]
MQLSLVGINHRTAPVAIREKAAIRTGKLDDSLSRLGRYVDHGIILSTCNRTEVYTTDGDGRRNEEGSLDFLKTHLETSDTDLSQYTYILKDKEAVAHLFQTTCGLDSMIIGEYEVLGQVGQALESAERIKMTNLPLRQLFQGAIRTGRRVREETGISKNALSVSSVAVDMATRVVGDLAKCRMLVIGAGEAGRLVAKAAKDRGVASILIASRTQERAAMLTEALGGTPISLGNLAGEMHTCDIIVTCADAPHWIVSADHVAAAMKLRSGSPMVIIDIAVPRNVEPAVAEIDNVYLYNIDGLIQISDQNHQQREGEIEKAVEIIMNEIAEFNAWWQMLEVRPVVSALMKKAEEIRRAQLDKTLKKLGSLSEEDHKSLEAMTKSIVTKILREPVRYLKANGDSNGSAEMVRELFRLPGEKPK